MVCVGQQLFAPPNIDDIASCSYPKQDYSKQQQQQQQHTQSLAHLQQEQRLIMQLQQQQQQGLSGPSTPFLPPMTPVGASTALVPLVSPAGLSSSSCQPSPPPPRSTRIPSPVATSAAPPVCGGSESVFKCKKCELTKPQQDADKNKPNSCVPCVNAYKSICDRWTRDRALHSWWQGLTPQEKSQWYVRQNKVPAGAKRKFHEVNYSEGRLARSGPARHRLSRPSRAQSCPVRIHPGLARSARPGRPSLA
jgi:hypothetical protein